VWFDTLLLHSVRSGGTGHPLYIMVFCWRQCSQKWLTHFLYCYSYLIHKTRQSDGRLRPRLPHHRIKLFAATCGWVDIVQSGVTGRSSMTTAAEPLYMHHYVKQELIRRWDSERELFLQRYRTRTLKYQKREPTSFSKLDDS